MLPKEAIQEFKQIYEKVFKEHLSDAEASRRANNLVELYQVIFKHSSSKNNTKEHDNEKIQNSNIDIDIDINKCDIDDEKYFGRGKLS